MQHVKKRTTLSMILAFFLLGAGGVLCLGACDGGTDTSGDTDTDDGVGPDVEPDPEPDVEPDPEPDPIEDPAQDEVVEDAEEEDAAPVQDPITFIVRNTSEETVYLDWQVFGNDLISGGRTTGGAWEPIDYWPPYCMMDCEDTEPGGNCCMACLPPPAVKELGAGEELTYEWNGQHVYVIDADYCICSCYRAVAVIPMGYRAEACVYHTYDCWTEPCEPDADGVINQANVTGDPTCNETVFDIPYAETEVVIEVP
jgi:hypothetical protein